MGLKDLKPSPGEGRGVGLGCLLSLLLHVGALVAVGVGGAAIAPPDGALLVVPFLAAIGLAQWIYLGPAAWLMRRRGAMALFKGILISGGLLTLGSTLCYGGMG